LRLGKEDCQIQKHCILEGELLVWNDCAHQIEPFYNPSTCAAIWALPWHCPRFAC
jgi:hypothetical protein